MDFKADELPALVRQLLEVGALDASLADGSEGLRALAEGWGWSVLADRAGRCRPPARARACAPRLTAGESLTSGPTPLV